MGPPSKRKLSAAQRKQLKVNRVLFRRTMQQDALDCSFRELEVSDEEPIVEQSLHHHASTPYSTPCLLSAQSSEVRQVLLLKGEVEECPPLTLFVDEHCPIRDRYELRHIAELPLAGFFFLAGLRESFERVVTAGVEQPISHLVLKALGNNEGPVNQKR